MTRKSDPSPTAEAPAEGHELLAEVQSVLAMLGDEDALSLSRKAKAAAEMLKTLMIKREFDAKVAAASMPIDLAGEEKLRDELLRRIDALAAGIAEAEGLEYPDAIRPRFDPA